jgi:hypothetical protein
MARSAHPEKGTIPFKLYDFQKDCIEDFMTHRYNIVLKGEQLEPSQQQRQDILLGLFCLIEIRQFLLWQQKKRLQQSLWRKVKEDY